MKMRKKIFNLLGSYIAEKYWIVLIICVIFTALMGFFISMLEFDFRWVSLMPQNHISMDKYKDMINNFDSISPIIVSVEGGSLKNKKLVAKELTGTFKKSTEFVRDVNYKIDIDFLKKHGFMLQKVKHLKRYKKMLRDFNLPNLLENMNNDFEKAYIEETDETLAQQEKDAVRFLDSINDVLISFKNYIQNGNTQSVLDSADTFSIGPEYYLSRDKSVLLLFVIPRIPFLEMDGTIRTARHTEKILDSFREKYSDMKFVQTGMHVITRDEMDAAKHDTIFNIITALIIVILLFIFSFRMIVSPLYSLVILITGVVWTLGLTWLFVGRLNVMTAMVGVILIGLGIDYSIHFITGYTQAKLKFSNNKEIFQDTYNKMGAGIMTGAFTTAVAFLVFVLVKIDAISEMGLVMGIGIICTFLASFFLLPSILVVHEKILSKYFKNKQKKISTNMEFNYLGRLSEKVSNNYLIFIIIVVLLTVFSIILIPGLKFSGDFKKIEARGLASLELMDTIEEKFDMTADSAILMTDSLVDAEEKTERLNKLNSVGYAESIVTYLPSIEKQIKRTPVINDLKRILNSQPELIEINKSKLKNELERLEANIIEMGDIAVLSGLDDIVKRRNEIANFGINKKLGNNIIDELIELINRTENKKLFKLQSIFAGKLKKNFLEMCNIKRVELKNIPEHIKSLFVSKDEKNYLINVYASKQVWDTILDNKFLIDVEKVDKRLTGLPVFMKVLIVSTAKGGKYATLLSLLFIFFIVLIDFKNIKYALISLIPLIIGGIWTLGFLNISGYHLTFMTVMILPMIIGIGIDDGVHIIHRYRIEGKDSIRKTMSTTGKAVTLTSLTTMVAFGSLGFSRMVGYQQFGISLFFAIGIMLILSVFLLPVILKLLDR